METETYTLKQVIAALNRMLGADPAAVTELLARRVACNERLAEDPSCQVLTKGSGETQVGALGLINGLFGTHARGKREGWGHIAAMYETKCADCGEPQPDSVKMDAPSTCCGGSVILGTILRFEATASPEVEP